MRRILIVDDDPRICQAIRVWLTRQEFGFSVSIADGGVGGLAADADFLHLAGRLGATRCLRKPFKPATLLDIIDECLSETEPHRRHVERLGRVTNARSEGHVVSERLDEVPGRHVARQHVARQHVARQIERSSLTAGGISCAAAFVFVGGDKCRAIESSIRGNGD
jgi:DNA-binding response OmpR family regulator